MSTVSGGAAPGDVSGGAVSGSAAPGAVSGGAVSGGSVPVVTVIGLGPGGDDLVTEATTRAIADHTIRFVRTRRHPSIAAVGAAESFDELYEACDTFAEVYTGIVERLVAAAYDHGRVLYAVPGSPVVAEHSVELLMADPRVVTVLVPALSFVDLAWVRLGIDPLAAGVRIIDGHRFAEQTAGTSGPFLVAQVDQPWVASDIKLSRDDADDHDVVVIQRLGTTDERIETVAWNDIDRIATDHLTTLYIEALPNRTGEAFAQFESLVERLRNECPWDAEQTHASLRRYLIEETYETIDALDGVVDGTGDYAHLQEELGDLLYQIYFHAAIATENGAFSVADVAEGIATKLYDRHPHVFGDAGALSADEVAANWEANKQAEKGRASVMEGIPDALPSLLFALKMHKKAGAVGVPFLAEADDRGPLGLVADALAEIDGHGVNTRDGRVNAPDGRVNTPDGWARLLFTIVGVMGQVGLDPEMVLRDEVRRRRRDFPE